MPRRLALAATVALLIPLSGLPSHAAGRGAGCLTVPDARGDAAAPPAALFRPPATEGVDIHTVTLRSEADRLVASISVGDISKQPATSTSTQMAYSFVLKGWEFTVFYDLGAAPDDVEGAIYYSQGIKLFGEIVSTKVQATVTGNTLDLAVPYDELQALRGKKVRGERLTQLSAATDANYAPRNGVLHPHQTFDTVRAAAGAAPVLGAACR